MSDQPVNSYPQVANGWRLVAASPSCCTIGKAVGFEVAAACNVGNRKCQRAGKFPTGPVQRVEPRAAARIFAVHLSDHDLGVRIDVQSFGVVADGMLQGLEQGHVFGDIVVLQAYPFGDAGSFAGRVFDDHANSRRPRISVGPAVNVSNQMRHDVTVSKMNHLPPPVKRLFWFAVENSLSTAGSVKKM